MPVLVGMVLALAAVLVACGGKAVIDGTAQGDGGADPRTCPPECYVGHECCLGSCSGPAVPMPSDCCSCLDGEVSSAYCGGLCGD